MATQILPASPHMSDEWYEKDYIGRAFESNRIASLGENVNGFEAAFAARIGVKDAAAFSGGVREKGRAK